ncbi:MAG: hypothetical protein IJE89_02375 [Bacilli bacterium]|nr:hypothetical protein [Bacilli bacterium]
MKNIEKKWMLFIIATFVTFLGIGYTLLKGTEATEVSEVPANSAFNDLIFYKCVIDSYNAQQKTNLEYTTNLTDIQLASITELSCNGMVYGNEDSDWVKDAAGIEKMTSLVKIDLTNNKLQSIDLSNNLNIKDLRIGNNLLSSIDLSLNKDLSYLILYSNQLTSLNVSNKNNLEYLDVKNNLLTEIDVNNCSLLNTLSVGNNKINSLNLNTNTNLNTLIADDNELSGLDLSNNKKMMYLKAENNQLEYIYVSNCSDLYTLWIGNNQLTNLDLSQNTKLVEVRAHQNKLNTVNIDGTKVLKSLNVSDNKLSKLNTTSNTNLEVLYVGNNQLTDLNLEKNLKLVTLQLDGNQLEKLNLSKNTSLTYLFLWESNKIITDAIYKNEIYNIPVDSPNIILPSSKNLSFTDITGISSLNIDNSSHTVMPNKGGKYSFDVNYYHDIQTSQNRFIQGYELYVIDMVSDKYVIDPTLGYIYTGIDADVNVINDNVEINYGTLEISNDKIVINYDGKVIKNFNLYNINLDNYELIDKNIIIRGGVSYENFISNISSNNEDIEYMLFNNDIEVTDGFVTDKMILKVYYDDSQIDEYTISNNYVDFNNNLSVNKDKNIVGNIIIGNTIGNILEMIDTNGSVSILDKDNNLVENTNNKLRTGDKIKVTFGEEEFVYTISVKGDLTSDGIISMDDIYKISNHIIKNDLITLDEYLEASDYDNNGKIDINDVIKMTRYIKDSGDTNE